MTILSYDALAQKLTNVNFRRQSVKRR